MRLKPYIWHAGSGALLPVKECKIVHLTDREATEFANGMLLPVDVNEFEVVVGNER